MKTEITTGNYKVLNSGSVISYDYFSDVVLKFVINDEGFGFNIHILFRNDKEIDGAVAKYRTDETDFFIECINFRGSLGMGLNNPLEIGNVNNKNIYFRYWVADFGDKAARNVGYTLYMEK